MLETRVLSFDLRKFSQGELISWILWFSDWKALVIDKMLHILRVECPESFNLNLSV